MCWVYSKDRSQLTGLEHTEGIGKKVQEAAAARSWRALSVMVEALDFILHVLRNYWRVVLGKT